MNPQFRQRSVYAFGLLAMGLIAFMVVLVTFHHKSFEPRVSYHTILKTAYGLAASPPVYFKGIQVGRVEGFELLEDNRVKVSFFVFEEYAKRIRDYSIVMPELNPVTDEISLLDISVPSGPWKVGEKPLAGGLLPSIDDELGKRYIREGLVAVERDGVTGVIVKVNQILEEFIANGTPEKVDKVVGQVVKMSGTVDRTIASYKEGGKAGEEVLSILSSTKKTLDDLNQSLFYLKETLSVVHDGRSDIPVLLHNTNRTLEKAKDTLQGINNNPLLKGGINKEAKDFGVEVSR